ncbi:unnamed protein product [Closterium sp. NIES-64]|nr:unnamed protein product [Closterium sp. NIES-64]
MLDALYLYARGGVGVCAAGRAKEGADEKRRAVLAVLRLLICMFPPVPPPSTCLSVAAWACAQLGEPKRGLVRRAVHALGGDAVRGMVAEVDAVQRCGGQLTADGKRRRTPGGVFWNILRARVSADVYNEIMAEERELQVGGAEQRERHVVPCHPIPVRVQKRRERGQASKKRRRQHKGGEGAGGSDRGGTVTSGGGDRERTGAMSLSLEGCTRDAARPHASDDAAAAADVAQGPGARWQVSSSVCVQGDDRQRLEHGVTAGGGGMVEDRGVEGRGVGEQVQCGEGRAAGPVEGREEEGVEDGGRGTRDGGGRGDEKEVVVGVVEGGVDGKERIRERACGGGRQRGGLGEGSSRARGCGSEEGLVQEPWEVHEMKKVRVSMEQKGGRVGVGVGTDVEEKVRLDEGERGGSVRQVLHAWRSAVMAGKGAGWEEAEEGEWSEADCATASLAMPAGLGVEEAGLNTDGEAGLKAGDVANVVGDMANGVSDANGGGDLANGVADVAANGVGDIHEREGREDPMEVDGECEEAVCETVPPCVEEQREIDQRKVVLQGEGAHAGASSSVDGGASEIASLSCKGVERGGTCGAAALPGVRTAQGGEQRVSVKQRLRMPVKYDDVPGTVEEVVEGSVM